MKPRITVITIGVNDLEKSLKFYRHGLGLRTQGIIGQEYEHGAVAMFDLHNGLKPAIWPRASIAHEAQLPQSPASPTEFTLGHNLNSKAEVDAVMKQAEMAGATIVKPKRKTHFGAAMRAIFKTRMVTCGKSFGIQSG